ncbi:glycosyltransferase [Candidatus Albibeggiatoa sp. nov. BB20]|uniref:glycosyltransferase n=1 Tax=Candidatus Albibeggiatoa sp. nov. BB20 TaxID=3162723 RepID=UPI0033653D63
MAIKQTILYDISVLGLGHIHAQSRTGIFRVTEKLALALAKHHHVNLNFCAPSIEQGERLASNYQTQHPSLNPISLHYRHYLPATDIYHSLYYPFPTHLHAKQRFLTVHDLIPIKFPHLFQNDSHQQLQQTALTRLLAKDKIFCVSESTKQDFCEYTQFSPENVIVTHLAADNYLFYPCTDKLKIAAIKYQYHIPTEASYFLSLATLEPRKNIIQAIDSFIQLLQSEKIQDLYLVLVGAKGWQYEHIFSKLKTYPELRQSIIFTDYVPDQDLAALYSGALAFVYPSLYEGFGLPPLEAMQCGVPVITSNTSSLPEVVGDAGLMLAPHDTETLSQYLLDIYTNQSLRESLAQKSLAQANQFSWDKFVNTTIDAYQQAGQFNSIEKFTPRQNESGSKLKVVIDGVFFQLANTGISKVWQAILKQWLRSGFAQHIVILDRAGTAPKYEGIEYRLTATYDPQRLQYESFMLQDICDKEQADIFISTYYTTPISTPSVLLVHDMIPEVLGFDIDQSVWIQKHHAIEYAMAYLVVSKNTGKDLLRFFPSIRSEQVILAYNGIEKHFFPAKQIAISQFKTKYNITKPYFLFVGHRKSYKNAQLFFQTFADYKDKQRFAIVCVGGSQQFEAELQTYITETTELHLLHLADEDLAAAYSGATALIYPSKYEGFGLPILEAMACACPVITCNNSSIPEVADDAVIYIDDNAPSEMKNALQLVQEKVTRRILIQQGLKQAKRFSCEKNANIISQLLIQVVQYHKKIMFTKNLTFLQKTTQKLVQSKPNISTLLRKFEIQILREATDYQAYNDRACVLLRHSFNNNKKALIDLKQAFILQPTDVTVQQNLALTYIIAKEHQNALGLLIPLAESTQNAFILEQTLMLTHSLGYINEAEIFAQKLDQLRKKTTLLPKFNPGFKFLHDEARGLVAERKLKQAADLLQQKLRSDPINSILHNDLAGLLTTNEQTGLQSIALLEKALSFDGKNTSIQQNFTYVCFLFEQYDHFIDMAHKLLAVQSNDNQLRIALAKAYLKQYDTENSKKELEKVIDCEPQHLQANILLVRLSAE